MIKTFTNKHQANDYNKCFSVLDYLILIGGCSKTSIVKSSSRRRVLLPFLKVEKISRRHDNGILHRKNYSIFVSAQQRQNKSRYKLTKTPRTTLVHDYLASGNPFIVVTMSSCSYVVTMCLVESSNALLDSWFPSWVHQH